MTLSSTLYPDTKCRLVSHIFLVIENSGVSKDCQPHLMRTKKFTALRVVVSVVEPCATGFQKKGGMNECRWCHVQPLDLSASFLYIFVCLLYVFLASRRRTSIRRSLRRIQRARNERSFLYAKGASKGWSNRDWSNADGNHALSALRFRAVIQTSERPMPQHATHQLQ